LILHNSDAFRFDCNFDFKRVHRSDTEEEEQRET
jgi:hypothetical protein